MIVKMVISVTMDNVGDIGKAFPCHGVLVVIRIAEASIHKQLAIRLQTNVFPIVNAH